jgi:membrane protein
VSDRSWRARARRAGSDALSRLDAARPRFRALDAGWDLWERDRRKAATLLAGALVYRLFVWLLPVTLLVASGLGFLADSDPQAPEDLAHDSGVGGYMVGVVGDAADQARDSRWYTLALALVGMALAGSGAVRALRLSHAVVWEVQLPKMRRAWLATLALLGVTLLAGGLAALSWKARAVNPGVGLAGVVGTTLAFAAVWLLASWLLPHADAPWWALVPGAVLGAAGVLAMHLVTVYYLAGKIESASKMYGSLGAAAAVLLWLSIFSRLMIVGAGLNATLWQRRSRGTGRAAPGQRSVPITPVG